MAARNSERLLNLVIALLATPRYISREQIRDLVEGYAQAKTEAGFQRMFERDKEDLRAMGVEILVGPTDPDTMEMDGYRIAADDFYLPEVQLSPQESTLVGLASAVWSEPELAAGVGMALAKLRAGGEQIDAHQASYLAPRLTAREPAFPVLWEALFARDPVGFRYHGSWREVNPWRLILRSGAWYLLGEAQGAGARMFKLARIETLPRRAGTPRAYTLPEPSVIAAQARCLEPARPTQSVLVAIRESAGGDLRRRGSPTDAQAPEGYEVVRLAYARPDEIVAAICAAGPDALVAEAGPIRQAVITQLRAVAGGSL